MFDGDPASPISIHTPHAGSDMGTSIAPNKITIFQSTLPMRGVTSALIDIFPVI